MPNSRLSSGLVADESKYPSSADNLESSLSGMPPSDGPYNPPGNGNFDFILNPKQAAKKPRLSFGLKIPRPVKIAAIVTVVLLLLIIIISVFTGKSNVNSLNFANLMARQQELVRISLLAEPDLKNDEAINTAATLISSLGSDQARLKTYLKQQKINVSDQQLNKLKNADTDQQLETAKLSNKADDTYLQIAKQQLESYRQALQTTYKDAGPNAQQILSAAYDSTDVILADL